MCPPCTTLSRLWSFSASSSPFSLMCATLFDSASTICDFISSYISVVLSSCACSLLVFSSSNHTIICVSCSWRGSNYACIYFFCVCTALIYLQLLHVLSALQELCDAQCLMPFFEIFYGNIDCLLFLVPLLDLLVFFQCCP
jgi:hypothetical protein